MRNVQELSPGFKPFSAQVPIFKHVWDMSMDSIKRYCHVGTGGKGTPLSCSWYFIHQMQAARSSCVGWQGPAGPAVAPCSPPRVCQRILAHAVLHPCLYVEPVRGGNIHPFLASSCCLP